MSAPTSDMLQNANGKILIVDDEREICVMIADILRDEGYKVFIAHDGQSGLKILNREIPDVCLLDVWLPDVDGLTVLEKIRGQGIDVSVVMLSGHANIETAVRSTRLGAVDFLEKPLSLEKLLLSVDNAIKIRSLRTENANLRSKVEKRYRLIGESRLMVQIRATIDVVAGKNSTVLITGENGTGKENVARQIHEQSLRVRRPFVAINCAAIPEDLIESELFGFEKGSFTGAIQSKRGKFEQANGGTIFLDEIGDMSLKVQSKVLRVLQEQRFERLGGDDSVEVDVRVIAATNKNLDEAIRKNEFREDLFYRLNVIPIQLPPLRERGTDIVDLANHYLSFYCAEEGIAQKRFSAAAEQCLLQYSWPGNIRELKNLMERLSIMASEELIDVHQLPEGLTFQAAAMTSGLGFISQLDNFRDARAEFEKVFILRKLKENDFNISRTAEKIGIERSHLYRKLKNFGIESYLEKRTDNGDVIE